MSKQFFFPALLFLVFWGACRKSEEITKPEFYWGDATALQNGKSWTGDPFARIDRRDKSLMHIDIDSMILDFYLKESLNIHNVPMKPGNYVVGSYGFGVPQQERDSLPSATFFLREHDVILASYDILEADSSNYIEVTSIDSATLEVKGTFTLTFAADWKAYSYLSDTIRFREGRFHTRLVNF